MTLESPARERVVMDTFVMLADTLASDYDIAQLLHVLLERGGEILGADTAGVMVETSKGDLQLAAALSEEMEAIERIELEAGEGPCVDAYRSRRPVSVSDLAACEERWPKVVPLLLELDMRAGHAFPLKLRDDCIGALNIYRRELGAFRGDDVRLAQAFADVAAIGILQQRSVAAAEERTAQLQHALDSRVIVEQAKGVLAQSHGITTQHAWEALRSWARDHRLKVHDVARRVVEGTHIDVIDS